MATKNSFSSKILIGLIKFYQYCISPYLGPRCRFYPSCSQYGVEALKMHGCIKGSWLICKRVLKCNRLSKGGYDPVPLNSKFNINNRDKKE